jgi:hypothetical protein
MKELNSEAGWRMGLSFLTSRLAKAGALAVFALIAAPGAKAGVPEQFTLIGNLNTLYGVPSLYIPFTGTMDLDFSSNFDSYQYGTLYIHVNGRSPFTTVTSVTPGSIEASNGAGDRLTLLFDTFQLGTWDEFNTGKIFFGDVIFGGNTGSLFGAEAVITRDLADQAIDLTVPITSAAVPELSTWAMMLVGLAGLGLAAKRRRAFRFLSERA